jgi:hypothetical protein
VEDADDNDLLFGEAIENDVLLGRQTAATGKILLP